MARPPRQSIPSFYLNPKDSEDDFYGIQHLNADNSETSDVFADPPSSSTDHSSSQQHHQAQQPQPQSPLDPFRFPLSFSPTTSPTVSNGRPAVAQQLSPAPSPVSRQRIPPPSAYIEPRPDSPGSISRGTDESHFPRPDPPFLRESSRYTSISRSSSAHSFAPAPQPWSGSAPSPSGLGNNTPPPGSNSSDIPRVRLKRKPVRYLFLDTTT